MEFEKFDNKKIDDIYNALCCRGLYMWECRDEKCPYHTDKYLPIEPCDVVQLREDFKNMINYLKAANVELVRHGRWTDCGSLSCRCSECGCKNNRETSFCPNCGAKMDKEEDHD